VSKHPWVQIPPGAIGVVVAQAGQPLPPGAKSALYSDPLGDFSNLRAFLSNGGQRGVQRPVLAPGTTLPLHPVAFIVATVGEVFGEILSQGTKDELDQLPDSAFRVVEIKPRGDQDVVGVVTALDGPPLPSGDMAGRLGGYVDIGEMETQDAASSEIIQTLLGSKNNLHNNYQDFQKFLDSGGCIGLQHDVLLYGSYLLNPLLVSVEIVPMLVVKQGEVAVMKSYVGLPTVDTSGEGYKFGSIVAPGHRGIWAEPLRTGKYPLNPRIYQAEVVSVAILALNWARATSEAHNLDRGLSSIGARSKDAFPFSIDLQVLIHVPDTKASKVIGMVGTMLNLVNEVLQSAVGNYFRNKLQSLGAIEFIEKRDEVQAQAETYIKDYLTHYDVEVRGVYIQDVVFPEDLVKVLTQREIANQEKTTYAAQEAAALARVSFEKQAGIAGQQAELARAQVSVDINEELAKASIAKAEGDATVTRTLGDAEAAKITAIGGANASSVEALGLAQAAGFVAQRDAIGQLETALVAVMAEVAKGNVKITPDTVVGGDGQGGLLTLLLSQLTTGNGSSGNGAKQIVATGPAEESNKDKVEERPALPQV
jgi:regulator of protease activity HflC (stomatin/prohibitin superfamily)